MVASSSNVITDSTCVLLPSMDANLVSRYDFGPLVTGLPSPSQNTPIVEIALPFSIAVNSAYTQCFWPSVPTMAYSHTPPTLKSIVLVWAIQGFGAIHFSISSGSVHAFHTFSTGALNSRST